MKTTQYSEPCWESKNVRPTILELQTLSENPSKKGAGVNAVMTNKVALADVERVAELAHLKLSSEETPGMVHDLNAILDYVAELNELDTDGVAPLAQISELQGAGGAADLRVDMQVPSLDRAVIMPQAPESDGVFFKVPKVIER